MWHSYFNGILVAFGLIMAIGAQNAFVLAQSLRREHHLTVAALCVFCDALLVTLGVFGLATLLSQSPLLLGIARWGGRRVFAAVWQPSVVARPAPASPKPSHRKRTTLTSRRITQRARSDAAQPACVPRYRRTDWLARRPASGTRRLCAGRCQRLVNVVFHPRHRCRLAGPLVGAPSHLAHPRSGRGGHDVQRSQPVNSLRLSSS